MPSFVFLIKYITKTSAMYCQNNFRTLVRTSPPPKKNTHTHIYVKLKRGIAHKGDIAMHCVIKILANMKSPKGGIIYRCPQEVY